MCPSSTGTRMVSFTQRRPFKVFLLPYFPMFSFHSLNIIFAVLSINHPILIYLPLCLLGFRAIGCGIALSTVSAPIIHAFLGPKTNNGSIPAIKLPIIVANIAKGKHGSDSGAYDTNGNFVPEKFEEIFTKHAHAHPDALTSDELKEMLKANQQSNDLSGSFASRTEWEILFTIAKNKDGLLQKDTVRSVYDGSLFYKLEAENKSPK